MSHIVLQEPRGARRLSPPAEGASTPPVSGLAELCALPAVVLCLTGCRAELSTTLGMWGQSDWTEAIGALCTGHADGLCAAAGRGGSGGERPGGYRRPGCHGQGRPIAIDQQPAGTRWCRGTVKRRAPVCLICPDRRLVSSYLWGLPSGLICPFWGRYLILSVPGPPSGLYLVLGPDLRKNRRNRPKSTSNKKIYLI